MCVRSTVRYSGGALTRVVQDGDANATVLVHVGVPHFGSEAHARRAIGVVLREGHDGVEEAPLVLRVTT